MREWFMKSVMFPERTVVNRKIPKKAFFTSADLSISDKEMFTSQIDGIYLLSVMNKQSMNISPYESEEMNYAEVLWIYINLRTLNYTDRIVKAVHKVIPNPVVLIIGSPDEQLLMSTCHKRLNKNDVTKVVIEKPDSTNWFKPKEARAYEMLLEHLAISKLSFENLYSLYNDVVKWLKCEKAISLTGTIPNNVSSRDQVVHALENWQEVTSEMEKLQQEQKGQLDFGAKMELHMKLKRQEQLIEALITQIKELC